MLGRVTAVTEYSGESRSPAARAILVLIRAYQRIRGGRPSPCRYWPTCSVYAAAAVERHGALHGSGLAARRLSRCHPWGGSGFDPVPD
ncbi:MAG: membrane protein insertion efficiency factor YidD [Acidimicrobiales bacterium]